MTSVVLAGLLQAIGLAAYISSIAVVLHNGMTWFGPLNNFTGPIVMLTLLSLSVLICGLISLGYPTKLIFVEKQYKRAIKIIGFTILFLSIFFALFVTGVTILK